MLEAWLRKARVLMLTAKKEQSLRQEKAVLRPHGRIRLRPTRGGTWPHNSHQVVRADRESREACAPCGKPLQLRG